MKKRALTAIFTLMILLSACGEDSAQYAQKAADFYGELNEYSATVRVSLDHGEYLSDYVLSHMVQGQTHTITVSEPLALSGLTMTADGESLELTFGDAVFLPQSLDGTNATPIKLLPDMLSALSSGNYEAVCIFSNEGESFLSLSVWTVVDGDEFMHRITLSTETLLPVASEVFFDGKSVMTAEYSDVTVVSRQETDQTDQ